MDQMPNTKDQYFPKPETPEFFPKQQPVNQQYIEGISGWLIFWITCFIVVALASLILLFISVTSGYGSILPFISTAFSIIMTAGFTTAVVFIFMRKLITKKIIAATLGAAALNSIICLFISGSSLVTIIVMLVAILIQLIFSAICVRYFYKSARVKQTLIK